MKRQQYSTIEEVQQAQRIVSSGVLIAERSEGHYSVKLYQLRSGYIEVFLHEHFNVIIRANHFSNPLYLEPYLHSIDISSAFV